MSKRVFSLFLVDVLLALERISRFLAHCDDPEILYRDEMRYPAVLKQFEIVGEALRYLVDEPALAHAKDSSWRAAMALRNIIVHEYFGVNYRELFRIVVHDVPKFSKSFEKICEELKDDPQMKRALETTRVELSLVGHLESARYIQKLEDRFYGKSKR